jgi:hypothetical protein
MRLLIALFAFALPAIAGDDTPLTGQEWRALVTGKTVEYTIGGQLWVREYYWPNDDVVTMEVINQTCFEARWEYNSDDQTFCFHNNPTSCFWHMREGDHYYVRSASPGTSFGVRQDVKDILETRLACSTAPVS